MMRRDVVLSSMLPTCHVLTVSETFSTNRASPEPVKPLPVYA